ncbi:hypothetical protein Deipr_0675 [Deinococcus proteolyticus MRP]|uniref:Uncharacterized protein n=1 Tax=Deinococcus proteolyticus (strain ATCC 35074 / DSM 20540 / JCM 6276 / NBRC 101906 / NCIMB 13154 / VKM Ac-1939 / CCM 2703 / MRP) TaxID=693977 RepID=F0RLD1_DEIPM|nr:hypothetical protein [Deinococcus proteolyticus]ADY25835.1 hypothetical protein Deipr_0675 [Deinococcus proteolyticus MRP]
MLAQHYGPSAQHIAYSNELVNFVNRYARALTGRTCTSFGDPEMPLGGLVLPKTEFTTGTAGDFAKLLTKNVAESDKRLGNTSKVMLDAPQQVVAVWVKAKEGSAVTVVQFRGERAMLTGCGL